MSRPRNILHALFPLAAAVLTMGSMVLPSSANPADGEWIDHLEAKFHPYCLVQIFQAQYSAAWVKNPSMRCAADLDVALSWVQYNKKHIVGFSFIDANYDDPVNGLLIEYSNVICSGHDLVLSHMPPGWDQDWNDEVSSHREILKRAGIELPGCGSVVLYKDANLNNRQGTNSTAWQDCGYLDETYGCETLGKVGNDETSSIEWLPGVIT